MVQGCRRAGATGRRIVALLPLLPLLALVEAAPARAETAVQLWPTLFASKALRDGWQASVETIGRVSEDDGRPGQLELRFQLGRTVAPRLTLWAGYVHVETFVAHGRNGDEQQAVEQLNWDPTPIGRVHVSSRTRLEQRFQRGAAGAVGWRVREQLRLAIAVRNDGPSVVLWAEPFVELARTPLISRTFDQLRSFVGLALPLNERVGVEFGYLHQAVVRSGRNLSIHALPLVVNARF